MKLVVSSAVELVSGGFGASQRLRQTLRTQTPQARISSAEPPSSQTLTLNSCKLVDSRP